MSYISNISISHFFKSLRLELILFTFFFYSCGSSVYLLDKKPHWVDQGYELHVNNLVKKANSKPNNPMHQINAAKGLTIHSFGFTMENADRLIIDDYKAGKDMYASAHESFSQAVKFGNKSLSLKYSGYLDWISGKSDLIPKFDNNDIEYLYWSAGAYGGAIKSSRGDPKWVILLPRVGRLLEAALSIDPDWNNGSLYVGMISYTMIRHDAPLDKELVATDYFNKAIEISNNLDASPYISLAENVCIPTQNKNDFTNLLYKALNIDMHAEPDLRLTNYINQKRAQWLLDNIDEFFY